MMILTFDCNFVPCLEALGHTVRNVSSKDQTLSLPALLERENLRPDLIYQQERLGQRLLIQGLEDAPCPTAFLAVDSHLNMFWHRSYARLFDTLLTPHATLFAALPAEWRHPNVVRFNHFGSERPWVPHAGRRHDLAVCARLTEHREIRTWLFALLKERQDLEHFDGLGFAAMLDLYADTKIVPNESIGFEVNFRLFEAASCGALVLTPQIGEDQDNAFVPGEEMLVYRDGLELLEQIAWAKAHPDETERMGRAAWERVQAEHLPRHRAAALSELAGDSTRHRAEGDEAARLLWLSAVQIARNGGRLWPVSFLLDKLGKFAPHPDVTAGQLRLWAESKETIKPLALCREVLGRDLFPDSLTLNATGSACALRLGDFTVARQFWRRHLRHGNDMVQQGSGDPENPFALCLLWADALRRAGRSAQPGFAFAPESGHVPEAAYEFLTLAQYIDSRDLEAVRRSEALAAQLPTYTAFRLGHLALLSLHAQDNWRLQLEYGLTSLRACRVPEGIFEVREAENKARAQGKSAAFERVLAAVPTRAYIERELLKKLP